MELTVGFAELVARAEREIESLSPREVDARLAEAGVLLVDLRDIRELKRDGKIPEAVHVPRGMLEFWIDPDCEYYKSFFDTAEEIVFYCNKGWRSALAAQTVKAMGFDAVSHMAGGFERWLEDVARVEQS